MVGFFGNTVSDGAHGVDGEKKSLVGEINQPEPAFMQEAMEWGEPI